ncbi:hypothetical protein [Streptosporangium subroseum]|uniref:hypothetical protein n=1 Tax=Streptosporangium subroseum TaxID=106412 RepID=UPI003092179F|nr:hypothetical protein OHB15_34840 [Streptosporangium subroseum]
MVDRDAPVPLPGETPVKVRAAPITPLDLLGVAAPGRQHRRPDRRLSTRPAF